MTYPIEPLFITNGGQYFYIGVESTGSVNPATFVQTDDDVNHGYFAAANILEFNFANLAANVYVTPPFVEAWAILASAGQQWRCECSPDIAGSSGRGSDQLVDHNDILALLDGWGGCLDPCPPRCIEDITGDCAVDVFDLLFLLSQWGPCGQ